MVDLVLRRKPKPWLAKQDNTPYDLDAVLSIELEPEFKTTDDGSRHQTNLDAVPEYLAKLTQILFDKGLLTKEDINSLLVDFVVN